MRAYRDALRSATSGAGVPYLEIPELTEQAAASNLRLFGELIHPNHIGHRLMTTRILNFLAAQGMLKKISAEAAEQEAP
jgi:phospholipase/lecithinase/hemolysin